MKRRELIKYLSVLPVSGAVAGAVLPFQSVKAEEMPDFKPEFQSGPKRLAAIITEYRPNSHADVIIGKYLEGFNQDQMAPYPDSKIVSMFTEQVPDNDMSRPLAKKYNVPIFRTVADALTLGGNQLAVDGVILIGEHGVYPMNDKEQKLYPRFEMFLKITDVFRQYKKSVPVFNDKHLSWSWRQAKRMVEISKELKFPMLAGSTIPVSLRIPAVDTPYGAKQKYAVGISFSGLDIYGFHLLDGLQAVVERRKGGETGVRAVQCLEGQDCWNYIDQNEWVKRLFDQAISHSETRVAGDMRELVKKPAVFIIDYNDGLKAAAFLLTGLLQDFTYAVDIEGQQKPFSTLMKLQAGKPHYHFGCLVKNMEIMFKTGKAPYPVERTMLSSGILDFALESRILGYKILETPELSRVRYLSSPESHFFSKGWDKNGKRLD
ncbi:MAG: hypothetical protein B7X86_09395 [Sphingobacteriales bacterium 17-39-43]|jgi:hypothetical protein|uniref:hypothetical protein n=1 Tax=Daejeonella sp. TaxID=2805397 RepID=UPI000BD9129D|nr:hypothetical protein [Daejeonella sp.]OYY03082.1 MAG: hypothetical protein B7Y76_04395 [Sphingobacteriia bacterium 35-40-5]OYZ31373.1 MAG: hypothetical protein B7Y24_09340 [Sphingobacteriales bacterium 16-39-50]OZA24289.1 MAG: hypothetical protein B7X86_09395 [Sphingobacteriales bacterium 17-39-43]HQT23074.1 hypothetical protein [Daejeonella sp.]HQT57960.1 hypothetical protein [Daejeonella sp.]